MGHAAPKVSQLQQHIFHKKNATGVSRDSQSKKKKKKNDTTKKNAILHDNELLSKPPSSMTNFLS